MYQKMFIKIKRQTFALARCKMQKQGPDLSSCLKQPPKQNNNNNHKSSWNNVFFETVDIRPWTAAVPRRREIISLRLIIAQLAFSREEGGIEGEPDRIPELMRKSWGSRETKATKVHRTDYQKAKHAQGGSPGALQRGPLTYPVK